jgi:serine/threonine-protein kinase
MAPGLPLEPRMLGRYALYEKIASGGMASVHIGRLLGPVGFARTVAIKRMHTQFAEDPEFVSMFLDEARLAARIRHPNVVPTLDVVTIAGELFLVMEYVQGESLARLNRVTAARGERIPHAMTATLMVGVLHGLHAAHEAKNDRGEPLGIVHRDVTPQNVLVGTDGAARVLDFGVAKAAGRLQTTREGQLKGKLAYMAPEQLRGTVTRATDVYAAAVVLWETLAGKRLFAGENDGDVFGKVLEGAKVPPSHYVPDLPPALDAVTMRGLRMDPTERFATAREMARALENAGPLVAGSVIGEWVETVAKETLEERSARIAIIETESASDSAVHAPPAPPSSGGSVERAAVTASPSKAGRPRLDDAGGPAKEEASVAIIVDEAIPTQLSSGSMSSPGRVSLTAAIRRPGSRVAIVGGSVGLLAVAALAVLWPHSVAPSARAPSPVDSSPPPSTSAEPPPAPPPEPLVVAPVLDASKAVPPPPATAKAPVRATPAPPSPPRATATAAPQCHPPFYFDSRGVRVFKPECL